jgi:metal-sulfur cluster biosynthetic enzyme
VVSRARQHQSSVPSASEAIAAAWDVAGEIHDPCSIQLGCPLTLTEMKLIESVEFVDDHLRVTLQLTEPTCMFVFRIGDAIKARLRERLDGLGETEVLIGECRTDEVWTEEMIGKAARERLEAARRRRHGKVRPRRRVELHTDKEASR